MVWLWRALIVAGGAWALNRGADAAVEAADDVGEGIGKGLEKALGLAAIGATVFYTVKLLKDK